MTQKEKLIEATKMAMRIKSIACSLKHDAKDYDVHFPLEYVKDLETIANNFLKLK